MEIFERFWAFIMAFLTEKKASAEAVIAILLIGITVAIGSVVGLASTALAKSVFDDMALSAAANTAMTSTTNTIYSSWPLSGLAVLAAFGALAIGVFITYIGLRRA